ncbi:hypothetical protein [Streptomyces acidicola]|uniref:Peptidase M41 domain-containing protein n=1 Tax=Streptomyces acidicola TaxID=2596892 RepID=A0A5N8WI44_9ACTN|nr:hypothetical protein [Streptomyces acidicola]MPY47123.1 hypothetical protein [Streptomyces acidicola]MPY47262.1 hypothetical protein [Streptomyces acidicola]
MTAAPANIAPWHTNVYVDGVAYPTRHYALLDEDDDGTETVLGLKPDELHYIRAIHEAAHAVTAIAGGAHLHHAQIETLDSATDNGGVTEACGLDDGNLYAVFSGAGERANDRWLREAGLWTPRLAVAVESGARSDRASFLEVNPHVGFGDREVDYRVVHDLADQVIDRHWREINVVADALVQQIRLDGDDIAGLIRIPNGPHRARNTEGNEAP